MSQFNEAVIALIEAYNRGISVIKTHRRRRKDDKARVGAEIEAAEVRLSKTLKKGKADVVSAYSHELADFGSKFTAGDEKSSSSLIAILFRLNAGFVNIIDEFTRGKCSRQDYQYLTRLSNRSRTETVETFTKLSLRLSQASKPVSSHKVSSTGRSKGSKAKANKSGSVTRKHAAAAVAPQRIVPSRPEPKSVKSADSIAKIKRLQATRNASFQSSKTSADEIHEPGPPNHVLKPLASRPPYQPRSQAPPERPQQQNYRQASQRMSLMSFASDSTKLGEIPERKWTRVVAEDSTRLSGTAYPLSPWQEEQKPRSRFMRLFKKQPR